jgi:hypothetical protein
MGNVKERDHWEDLGVDGRYYNDIKEYGNAWAGLMWLSIEESGELL